MGENNLKVLGFCWVMRCGYWYAETGLLTKHPNDPKTELIGISASNEKLECPVCECETVTEILTTNWLEDLKRLQSEAWQSLNGCYPYNWAQQLWWEKHGVKHETEVCSDCLNPHDLTYDEDEDLWLCPRCI